MGYLEEEAVKTYTHCIEVYLKDITNTLAICGGVVYRILVHLVNGVCRPILKQYVTDLRYTYTCTFCISWLLYILQGTLSCGEGCYIHVYCHVYILYSTLH